MAFPCDERRAGEHRERLKDEMNKDNADWMESDEPAIIGGDSKLARCGVCGHPLGFKTDLDTKYFCGPCGSMYGW